MSAILSKWDSAIHLFAEYHKELGVKPISNEEEQPEQKVEFKYGPVVSKFANSGLKYMADEGYIEESEIETYLSEINSTISEISSDNKKAAIFNLVGTLAVPLLPKIIDFFKELKNNNGAGQA